MNDRFMNGFIAGVIANMPVLALDMLAGVLRIDKSDYIHFVSILAYQSRNLDIGETLFAIAVQTVFAGVLGVIFNYLILYIEKRYFYSKALIYGAILWFSIYSLDVVFKIEDVVKPNFKTALTHCVLSLLWGFLMAFVLRFLVEKQDARDRDGLDIQDQNPL